MFEIEKGVPITRISTGGRGALYPWGTMEVGDSFMVPDKTVYTVSACASSAAKRHNAKFVCRTVNGSGVRVWRVA